MNLHFDFQTQAHWAAHIRAGMRHRYFVLAVQVAPVPVRRFFLVLVLRPAGPEPIACPVDLAPADHLVVNLHFAMQTQAHCTELARRYFALVLHPAGPEPIAHLAGHSLAANRKARPQLGLA